MNNSDNKGHFRDSLVLLAIIFSGSLSCLQNKGEEIYGLPLCQVIDSLVIQLDNETPNIFKSPQIIKKRDSLILVNTFSQFNFIKLFDFRTGKTVKSIEFESTGKYKINDLYGAYFLDSVNFFFLDGILNMYEAKVSKKLSFNQLIKKKDYDSLYFFYPRITGNKHPIVKLNENEFVLGNYFQFRKGRPLFNIFNYSDKIASPILTVPDEFVEGFFGADGFRQWNFVHNPKKGNLVVNFPNLDDLYVYDLEFKTNEKYFIKSSIKFKPIKKIVKQDNYEELNKTNRPSAYIVNLRVKSNMVYHSILFDSDNNCYYRIVGHPISRGLIESEDSVKSNIRKYSIMVIDSDFKLIKEFAVPFYKYLIEDDSFFVYGGHLYLQRRIEDENKAIFDKIKLFDV